MDEAGVPVNDEVSNEILIKHDPDNPSIHVGTLFSTMDDLGAHFSSLLSMGSLMLSGSTTQRSGLRPGANYGGRMAV